MRRWLCWYQAGDENGEGEGGYGGEMMTDMWIMLCVLQVMTEGTVFFDKNLLAADTRWRRYAVDEDY